MRGFAMRGSVPTGACLSLSHLRKLPLKEQHCAQVSTIEDLSSRSAKIRSRLYDLLVPHEYPADDRTAWVTASVALALEYQETILLLIRSKLFGSAFAMVRSIFDTMSRALWINAYATEARMKQASRDKMEWPRMGKMLDEVKEAYFDEPQEEAVDEAEKAKRTEDAALVADVFQRLKNLWPIVCSYTHSGALQIARRFTNGDLKPHYTEGEIIQAIKLTNAALLMFVYLFFRSMGQHREAIETVKMLCEYTDAEPASGLGWPF